LSSAKEGLQLTRTDVGLLQRRWWWDGVSGLVEVGRWLGLRRERAVMLSRVLGFGSVVVVHGVWKLGHLPLVFFWCTCCSSTVV